MASGRALGVEWYHRRFAVAHECIRYCHCPDQMNQEPERKPKQPLEQEFAWTKSKRIHAGATPRAASDYTFEMFLGGFVF